MSEGEAGSSRAVVSVGAGLLISAHGAGRPQRNWGGVCSGLPFHLARLGFIGSQTL